MKMKIQLSNGMTIKDMDLAGRCAFGMIRNDGFIPRHIQRFMEIDRDRRGLPHIDEPICNHGFQFIWKNGGLHVCEAIAKGVVIRPFMEAYPYGTWHRIVVYIPEDDMFFQTFRDGQSVAPAMAQAFCLGAEGKKYRYMNFIWYINDILRNRAWHGSKDSSKYYCTQLVAAVQNLVYNNFPKAYETTPYELQIAPNYEAVTMNYYYE